MSEERLPPCLTCWDLIKDKFIPAGELAMAGELTLTMQRTCNAAALKEASVYVMVAEKGDELDLLYAVMAGTGWKTRYKQHNGGLNEIAKELKTEPGDGTKWAKKYLER